MNTICVVDNMFKMEVEFQRFSKLFGVNSIHHIRPFPSTAQGFGLQYAAELPQLESMYENSSTNQISHDQSTYLTGSDAAEAPPFCSANSNDSGSIHI